MMMIIQKCTLPAEVKLDDLGGRWFAIECNVVYRTQDKLSALVTVENNFQNTCNKPMTGNCG